MSKKHIHLENNPIDKTKLYWFAQKIHYQLLHVVFVDDR